MKKIKFAALAALAFVGNGAFASDMSACKALKWLPDHSYNISAKLHHGVHVELPEAMVGRPIVGNSELWTVDGAGKHVFLKPNTLEKEGYSSTITIIGESGQSYDFHVTRKTTGVRGCIKIKKDELIPDESREAMLSSMKKTDEPSELTLHWMNRYQSLKVKHKADMEKAVVEAVRKYRYHIYTRYDWTQGSGFLGKNLISDVYDDGRFTYIRLGNDNKGLLSLESELGGKTEIIEADYDPVARMYRVAGIYPEFTLKHNKAKVKVSRANNETQGAF